ncbi:MAG: alpha/beta hydrolase [Ignavibacteria bacterium]|nr:alpha/beta hydrolase [Ignavibacteria bacterium]
MQFAELVYPVNVSYMQLPNETIAYYDTEIGETTLLFIHGLASYIPAWLKLIPLLSAEFRCIAIDLPGYGKSTAGVHSGSQEYYAHIIRAFIEKLQQKNVVGVGHSMGGQIVLTSAIAYPTLFSKLVLMAPAGFETFSANEISALTKTMTWETYAKPDDILLRQSYNANFYSVPEDMEPMLQDRIKMRNWPNFTNYCKVIANSLNGMLESPVYPNLGKIQVPACVMYGKNDYLIPHPGLHKHLTVAQVASRGCNQNELFELSLIDHCGHFIPFEKPKEASVIMQNFLRG